MQASITLRGDVTLTGVKVYAMLAKVDRYYIKNPYPLRNHLITNKAIVGVHELRTAGRLVPASMTVVKLVIM